MTNEKVVLTEEQVHHIKDLIKCDHMVLLGMTYKKKWEGRKALNELTVGEMYAALRGDYEVEKPEFTVGDFVIYDGIVAEVIEKVTKTTSIIKNVYIEEEYAVHNHKVKLADKVRVEGVKRYLWWRTRGRNVGEFKIRDIVRFNGNIYEVLGTTQDCFGRDKIELLGVGMNETWIYRTTAADYTKTQVLCFAENREFQGGN